MQSARFRADGLSLVAVLLAFLVLWFPARSLAAPPDRFAVENVVTGIDQPISIRFLPDGRMLLVQKKGAIRICNVLGTTVQSEEYVNLAGSSHIYGVDFNQERGLLDLAVDPNFPASPYIYILYTPAYSPDTPRLRVSRFTHIVNSGQLTSRLDPGSEQVLWQDTEGYDSCCHYGGGLDFGPDGNLWLTTGDHFQGSYAASWQHAGGKVHRFRKDGTIPPGNPYADGAGPNVDSLFAIGLRNPFRARWDLSSRRFFIAEVGGNTQSTAWEDLHVINYNIAQNRFVDSDFGTPQDNGQYNGINFGWPTVEGPPPHTDFPGAVVEARGEPIFSYPHAGVTAAINGGIVYHGSQFPSEYSGAYFYADSTRDFVRYLKFNSDGSVATNPSPAPLSSKNPDSISHSFDLAPVGRIVSLEVGPDGALYYVSFTDSGGAYGEPNPSVLGAVRRYVFDGGNRRPEITAFSTTPAAGPTPLATVFSFAAVDLDNDSMTYLLDFGDGSAPSAGAMAAGQTPSVAHNYQTPGVRLARLDVSDGVLSSSSSLSIQAGTPPTIGSLTAVNGNPVPPTHYFRYGDTYTFAATAVDSHGNALPPESFSWSVVFVRPGNIHPSVGPVNGVANLNFPIPAQGQGFSGPVYYRCFVTVTDGDGLPTTGSIDIFPEKALVHLDSEPSGIVVQVNGNTAVATPYDLDTLTNYPLVITVPQSACAGGQHQVFTDWSNGAITPQQTFVVPPGNFGLTAYYVAGGPCTPSPSLVLGGLVVHLEADQNVSLQSGNLVAGWLDRSGSGNDLVASGNPQLAAGLTPSGQSALRFDGNGDKLERVNASNPLGGLPTGNADRTMFMVVRYPGGSTAWAGAAYGAGAPNQAFGLVAKDPSGELVLQGWGSGNDLVSTEPGQGAGWMVQGGMLGGGTGRLYKNGIQVAQFPHTYNTTLSKLVVGEEIAGLGFMTMDVSALLIYDRALSEQERADVESYLHKKYLEVNAVPVLAITSPGGNVTVSQGRSVTFSATATDAEDGNLGPAVTWSSSLDGSFGIGAAVSTTALSVGVHTITATVSDSGTPPQQASASVNVTVLAAGGGVPVTGALVLRLEADDGVGLAGGTVGSWSDLSGRGNSLVAAGNPQWVAGLTPSGQPALRLNGSGDKLERIQATQPLSGLPTGNADRTMFMVVRYPGGSTAWAGAAYGAGTPNQAFGLVAKNPSGELVLQGWGSGNDLVSTEPGQGAGWMVQGGMVGGGTGRLYKNGTQVAQFPHTYNTTLSKLVVGEEIAGLGFMTMDVAALLIYDRALSEVERAGVESYLRKKYFEVNAAPVLAITSPGGNVTVSQDRSVTFTATATDAEDGDLGPAVTWFSSRDGRLGTGSAGSTAGLSVGVHVITATVIDSGIPPKQASASVTVTVAAAGATNLQDDLRFRLRCVVENQAVRLSLPELKTTGNYYLHYSQNLVDLADPSNRIRSMMRPEILAMDAFSRSRVIVVQPLAAGRGFFQLFFETNP